MKEYYLQAQYDNRKEFYRKAVVEVEDGGKLYIKKLYSYNTLVATITDGTLHIIDTHSVTTLRHIREFMKQNGFNANLTKSELMKVYGGK